MISNINKNIYPKMEDKNGQKRIDSEFKHVTDIVGEWGKWQFNYSAHLFVIGAVVAINNMGFAFMGYNNKFWCSDSPLEASLRTSDH